MVRNTIATLAVVLAALTASAGVRHPTPAPQAASAGYGILAAPQEAWAWPLLLPVPVRALDSGSAVAADLEVEQAKWEASVVAWRLAETLGRLRAEEQQASRARAQAANQQKRAEQATAVTAPSSTSVGIWDQLAQCESGGRWSLAGARYSGGLQFTAATWRSVGGTGLPHQHSREVQIEMGRRLQARSGWGSWPTCARRLGLLR